METPVNMDESISSGQEGDLLSYIQSQNTQAVQVTNVDDLSGLADTGEPTSGATGNVPASASEPVQSQEVTNPPVETPQFVQPGPSEQLEVERAARMRMEETVRTLLAQQAKAEEQNFLLSLRDLDEHEQEVAKAKRAADMANARAALSARQMQALYDAHQHRLQQEENYRQNSAKAQVAIILAERNGLPVEDVRDVLMSAAAPDQMEKMVQTLVKLRGNPQSQAQPPAQNPVQQLHPNAFTAGGSAAPASSQPKVAERSGNLLDYISSRGYMSYTPDS